MVPLSHTWLRNLTLNPNPNPNPNPSPNPNPNPNANPVNAPPFSYESITKPERFLSFFKVLKG